MSFQDGELVPPMLPPGSASGFSAQEVSGDHDWDVYTNCSIASGDMECDAKGTVKRKTRNLSEKKRRDQFNMLINEMALIVSTDNRRMNKSTVLKSAISFLQTHKDITTQSSKCEIQGDWKPSFLLNVEFTQLVLEASDSFILVFTRAGTILYASDSVTSLLGHPQNRLVNTSIYDLAHPSLRSSLQSCMEAHSHNIDANGNHENLGQEVFNCHLRRWPLNPKDPIYYEAVTISGHFRSLSLDAVENGYDGFRTSKEGEKEPSLCFMSTVKVHSPPLIREITVVDESKSEFTSRLSLEWNFLFVDHRAASIIGYQPLEVLGTSCYEYFHPDDLEGVAGSHEELLQKGEGDSCVYRFLSKGQQWIWMRTHYYITYHQWTARPEFVVCTNTVVNYPDAQEMYMEQLGVSKPDPLTPGAGVMETTSQSDRDTPEGVFLKPQQNTVMVSSRKKTEMGSQDNTIAYQGAGNKSSQDLSYRLGGSKFQKDSRSQQQHIAPQPSVNMKPQGINQTFLEPTDRPGAPVFITPWYVQGNIQMNAVAQVTTGQNEEMSQGYPSIPVIHPTEIQNPVIVPEVAMAQEHTHLQEELQEKSDKLQMRIKEQQEELKKLTDQLNWSQKRPVFPITSVQPVGDPVIFGSNSGMANFSKSSQQVSTVGCPVYTIQNPLLPMTPSTSPVVIHQSHQEGISVETPGNIHTIPIQQFHQQGYYLTD